MKRILVLISVFFFVQCSANRNLELYNIYNSDDYLYWSKDRKLIWDDFQGEAIVSNTMTCECLIYNPSTAEKANIFSKAEITSICVFDKKKSWANKELVTTVLLQYNQVIFDIYELFARKLRKEFYESKVGLNNLADAFHTLSEKNNSELYGEIQKFRKECNFGQDQTVILEWSKSIRDGLNVLNDFAIIYGS